jgi:hypothetical protein
MKPYYEDISDIIPFHVDDLLNKECLSTLPLNFKVEKDNYVRKNVFQKDILNKKFVEWVEDRAEMKIDKVVLWHWLCNYPDVAHIDCNPQGKIAPNGALNWTLSKDFTSVQWFNTDAWELKVSMNNEDFPGWDMPNVEAYISVKVNQEDRDDEWSSRGPAIINTTIPHMIYAPTTRVSISLQFAGEFTYQELLDKFRN